MVILPKLIHTFNTILISVPSDFFAKIDKLLVKFLENYKGPKIPKTTLKRNKLEKLILYDFKT